MAKQKSNIVNNSRLKTKKWFMLFIIVLFSCSSYSPLLSQIISPLQNNRNLKLSNVSKKPNWYYGYFPQSVSFMTLSKLYSKPKKAVAKRVSLARKDKEFFYLGVTGISFIRLYFGDLMDKNELEFIEQFNSPNQVTAMAFHPNSTLIAFGDNKGIVTLIKIMGYKTNWKHKSRIRTKKVHHAAVNSLIFSPDGRYLISGGQDYQVKTWDILIDQTKTLYNHTNIVSKVDVSGDGKYLASSSYDQEIILYQLRKRKKYILNQILKTSGNVGAIKHNKWISDLAFHPNSHSIISVGYDRKIIQWDIQKLDAVSSKKIGVHRTAIQGVAYSPSGKLIASSGSDGRIILWQNGVRQKVLKVHDTLVKNLFFSPDDKYLYSSSNKGLIVIQTVD